MAEIEALSLAEWQVFSPLFAEDVKTRVTAWASVQARRTPQSTNPEAVARACLYFAEGADYTTGAELTVDGGRRDLLRDPEFAHHRADPAAVLKSAARPRAPFR